MAIAKKDGTVVLDGPFEDVVIGSVSKDGLLRRWRAVCAFCEDGILRARKGSVVDDLEEHYRAAHITPAL